MRVLLDTNIVIHRENKTVSNYSIGLLFNWLDRLRYTKVIHPLTIEEINKYDDDETLKTLNVKLDAYNQLRTVRKPSQEFLNAMSSTDKTDNDKVDNYLLYETYLERVDLLITEDRKMKNKAEILGISHKVLSINQFITKVTAENPEQINYNALAVKKVCFGDVDLSLSFFDSFRRDYEGFDTWYRRKCDEDAYICEADDQLVGFLYLKVENEFENYNDIEPIFDKRKRLKVGTFKVESTGFRLGERFIKIIFDNAILYSVDEIYVTLFNESEELTTLIALLERWGFKYHGIKSSANGEEKVFVKSMKTYTTEATTKENFPNILYNKNKYILPIFDQFHTSLFPDSILANENEGDFIDYVAYRYALQKVYISWTFERNVETGDLIVIYRAGPKGSNKKYTSVLTTIGVIDEIIDTFSDKQDFLNHCQNRSVFTDGELDRFWRLHRDHLKVVKIIYLKSMGKKLKLEYLWAKDIVNVTEGPRPFTKLTDEQFNGILRDSDTEISFL